MEKVPPQVVRVGGPRLDASSRGALTSAVEAAWKRGATAIVLDMRDVTYVDSLGISILVALERKRAPGTRIVVSDMCDYVRDVFEITQLFRVFDVFANADAATRALSE